MNNSKNLRSLRNSIPFLLLTFALVLSAVAADKKPTDIGDLEVNGGVRKPLLGYVESDRALRDHLQDTSKAKLESFEKKISRFTTVSEWKGEPDHDYSTHR